MEIVKKREDYISWDDFFMAIACVAAMRSKDPGSRVGACIVNKENKIVGVGYNGLPRGCSDDELPWNSESDDMLNLKYTYVCHAEANSILNKNESDTRGCRMYVTLFPCNECAKLIIQSGIEEVIYISDKYQDKDFIKASKKLLDMAGVKYWKHTPNNSKIVIDLKAPW